MEPEFWKARWEAGQTGFHLDRVNPHLLHSWEAVANDRWDRVFVPLSGKTLDMAWLAARGHEVIGVEVSETAVASFFREQELEPVVEKLDSFSRYRAGAIEILCGDFFALTAAEIGDCTVVYDRAALVALPQALRASYAAKLIDILPRAQQLLITFDYDQTLMDGPPFAVSRSEVETLYEGHFEINPLQLDVDILAAEPKFAAKGLDWLTESSFRLSPR